MLHYILNFMVLCFLTIQAEQESETEDDDKNNPPSEEPFQSGI